MDNNAQKIANQAEIIKVEQQTNNIYNLLDIKAVIIILACAFVIIVVSIFVKSRKSITDQPENINSTQNSNTQNPNLNTQSITLPSNKQKLSNHSNLSTTKTERNKKNNSILPSNVNKRISNNNRNDVGVIVIKPTPTPDVVLP